MFDFLLYVFLSIPTTAHQPIQYPINASLLVPCGGNKAFGLCRPPLNWSQGILDYISELDITDPYFYDAFEESEIYNWFRPRRKKSIVPFYIWENEDLSRDVTTDTPAFLQDLYSTFLQDMRVSSWRTYDASEAAVHFVAIPWSPWVVQGSRWEPRHIDEYLEKIITSDEFLRYNGTNFFYVTSGWQKELVLGQAGRDFFNAVQNNESFSMNKIPIDVSALRLMGGLHYGSFPVLRTCTITTHYSTTEQLRSQRKWPGGSIESYRYPLGHYAQMLQKRKHKFFFVGQADHRPAYAERRKLFSSKIPFICSEGVIIRTSGGPEELEECEKDFLCQCQMPKGWRGDASAQMLLDSLFAFHIKGDDYYSARIVDIISSGSIPIVVDKALYGMSISGQCHAPWREMAIYLNLDAYNANPESAIHQAINSLTHQDIEKMVRLLYYYRPRSVNGNSAQNLVGEDRVSQYIYECVPETILQQIVVHTGRSSGGDRLSKLDIACDFENFITKQALPLLNDEDEHPAAWDCLFLRPHECPGSAHYEA